MTKEDYAEKLLESMDTTARKAFVKAHGPEAYVRLWYDAHRNSPGDVPRIPDDHPLGGDVLRRADFDELNQAAQHMFVTSGGLVID